MYMYKTIGMLLLPVVVASGGRNIIYVLYRIMYIYVSKDIEGSRIPY